MKFGKYIDEQARPDWRDKYLDYGQLKQYIKEAVAQLESGSDEAAFSPRTTSLSVTKNANNSPESNFFNKLELEVSVDAQSALPLPHKSFRWCIEECTLLHRSRKFLSSQRSL